MERLNFGKKKPKLNPFQRETSTSEARKRFMMKCLSGGFGDHARIKPKITLAPVPSLNKPEKS